MKATRLVLAGLGLYLYLTGLLLAAQSTPPPTGKFGLPAAKPATTASSAVPSSPASTPATAPVAAPAPAAAPSATTGTIQRGANIVAALAYGTLAKQGKIANGDKVECVKYHFDEGQTLDPNSGLPTGKKTSQLTITKQWDTASIQLLQALATNETLQTLTLEFLGSAVATGAKQVPLFTVTLTTANVVAVHQYLENKVALEDVVLTFNKMDVTTQNKSTTLTDAWTK